MTMFSLPSFCRVCLKYDKNLIDLEHIENEPNETLMSKLQLCVSEVEWSVFKPLLCHPCIKRLNTAYSFKKQCVQSATVLKSYLTTALEKGGPPASQQPPKGDVSDAYIMLPNQKYIKIVLGGQQIEQQQNQNNALQNVFFNLIPTSDVTITNSNNKDKDTNQNVFLNINDTFQKYVADQKNSNDNVNQILTEGTSEELSVEIDPTDLGLGSNSEDDEPDNDWEDIISSSQISNVNGSVNGGENNAKMYASYVPILPKQPSDDFSNSGQHFLSSSRLFATNDFFCDTCQKQFPTIKQLKKHNKEFHILGRTLFKCDYCYNEYETQVAYEACVASHKAKDSLSHQNSTITLKDINKSTMVPLNVTPTAREMETMTCELCQRPFTSAAGLLRHKVRKHNQKSGNTRKKYFVKGMKNARCDICNREFSTQSYMLQHRKLHMRDDIGYKYKVFGKNRYQQQQQSGSQQDSSASAKNDKMEVDEVEEDNNNSESEEESPKRSDDNHKTARTSVNGQSGAASNQKK